MSRWLIGTTSQPESNIQAFIYSLRQDKQEAKKGGGGSIVPYRMAPGVSSTDGNALNQRRLPLYGGTGQGIKGKSLGMEKYCVKMEKVPQPQPQQRSL